MQISCHNMTSIWWPTTYTLTLSLDWLCSLQSCKLSTQHTLTFPHGWHKGNQGTEFHYNAWVPALMVRGTTKIKPHGFVGSPLHLCPLLIQTMYLIPCKKNISLSLSLSISQLSVSFRLMYNMESAVNAASTVYLSCIGIPEEWMQ